MLASPSITICSSDSVICLTRQRLERRAAAQDSFALGQTLERCRGVHLDNGGGGRVDLDRAEQRRAVLVVACDDEYQRKAPVRQLPLRRQNEPLRVQPHAQTPFGGNGTASCAPADGMQYEPDAYHPCPHEPPGPMGFGCGSGCAKAPTQLIRMMIMAMPMIRSNGFICGSSKISQRKLGEEKINGRG